MSYNLKGLGFAAGDIVVVTGAASGIGRATACLAARSGLTVVGWDLQAELLESVVDEVEAEGGRAHAIVCDQTDEGAVAAAWDRVERIGPVKYLVNNAGPPNVTPLTYSEGLYQAVGPVTELTEEWIRRFGAVVEATTFTASTGALLGTANWYGVAKAALAAYARSVAVRHGGRPRANTVAPGFTETPRTAPWAEMATSIAARNPLRRVGQAEEVAAAICFLLSPAASYINGALLPVDGGSLLTTG